MALSKQQLEAQKCGLFATKQNTEEALNYALQLARAEGMPEAVMTTAIIVYHNSLINQLVPYAEDVSCKGGHWLGEARTWMQNNIRNGSTLEWSSNETVHLPFYKLQELAEVVAKATQSQLGESNV